MWFVNAHVVDVLAGEVPRGRAGRVVREDEA